MLLALLALAGTVAPARSSLAREAVRYESDEAAGTIIIDATRRKLFFVLGDGRAIAYPVGVPRRGAEWSGSASVNGKFIRPDWIPPREVKEEEPLLPGRVKGGAANNPMGARAITLDRSDIAIHGSTRKMRATIGSAVSHGCIRMRNEDVIDLYGRVHVGTPVLMVP